MNRLPAAFLAFATLAAPTFASAQAASDKLYVGYYQEDPLTNPEDPTMGSIYLSLPAGDSGFAGSMSFTYVGCQGDGVGTVSGAKSGNALKGEWRGTVDGTAQDGAFAGAWAAQTGGYAGTYTVAGGKQHVEVPSCISYWIAPRGTWELLPVGASAPAGFSIALAGSEVRWTPPAGVAMTLVYVLDPELAAAPAGHAARWQTLVFGPATHATDLRIAHLKPGHTYVAVVSAADASLKRIGFASKTFVAP